MAWKQRKAKIRARHQQVEQEQDLARFRAFLRRMIVDGAAADAQAAAVSDELIDAIIARVDAGGSLSYTEIQRFLGQAIAPEQQVMHARLVAASGEVHAVDVHLTEEDRSGHPELQEHYRYVFEDGVRKVEITSASGRKVRDATVPTGVTARA